MGNVKKETTIGVGTLGMFCIKEITKGWPNAGFKEQKVEISLRGFRNEPGDYGAEVSVLIITHHEKRKVETYASLCPNIKQAEAMRDALNKAIDQAKAYKKNDEAQNAKR